MRKLIRKLICKLFGHKKPNYRRDGCFMWCKRCGGLIAIVGRLYGIKYEETNEKP